MQVFITRVDTNMSSLYRGEKNRESIEILAENKHIDGLEINVECVLTPATNYTEKLIFSP